MSADLTPRQIVAELDRYIVGQSDAKRAVAVALRNRWRRQRLPEDVRADVAPRNILMIGPTGVGKTEIARRLAALVQAPFIKVEATKFTEVGYHGRDVDAIIRDLLDVGIGMVRAEAGEAVRARAQEAAEERLLDLLLPLPQPRGDEPEAAEKRARTRDKLRQQLRAGDLDDREVELSTQEKPSLTGILGPQGAELDVEWQQMFERMIPARTQSKRLRVREARGALEREETEKLLDRDKTIRQAIERTEQTGIVFLDEIDKVAGSDRAHGPDVSRQGVQRDLLPIVEGSTVMTKHGAVRTDHILFIAAGAFHSSKPSDLMPELQGRFPIRVELSDLTREDFARILREPRNALTRQQIDLLAVEGLEVRFDDAAIDAMAQIAWDLNRRTQNIGARRLQTIMERVFEQISFDAPDLAAKQVRITADLVRERLAAIAGDDDLSRFIL